MAPVTAAGVAPLTGSQLTRGRRAVAFSLVTTLIFTWGFSESLLDVVNAHFQIIFGINKTQGALLQYSYFGAHLFFAPIAGAFMRKYGYKAGIHLGLTLYGVGAVFFWPSAQYEKYGGFVGATFVIGCGLASLEVAADSYISVLGTPKYAAARLNFSQGCQSVASFTGPLIASRCLPPGATMQDTVHWVYLAVAGLGVVLNVLFYFCHLSEIEEEAVLDQIPVDGVEKKEIEPFWKQYRCIFGFVAQTAYCGAQVGVASMAINLMFEQGTGINQSEASQLFSYCQLTFIFGRYINVGLLSFVDPALLLSIYGLSCATLSMAIAFATSKAGIGCLFALFFFESICYPCIFTLGTKNLGVYTKLGSGLIVMGFGGGVWYPPAQASVADRISTRRSYLVPFSGYFAVTLYAIGLVIDQTRKNGFRFWNVDEERAIIERERTSEKRSEESIEDLKHE